MGSNIGKCHIRNCRSIDIERLDYLPTSMVPNAGKYSMGMCHHAECVSKVYDNSSDPLRACHTYTATTPVIRQISCPFLLLFQNLWGADKKDIQGYSVR